MAVLQACMQARLVCCMLSLVGTSINNRHLYTCIDSTVCSQLGQPAQLACLLTCQLRPWAQAQAWIHTTVTMELVTPSNVLPCHSATLKITGSIGRPTSSGWCCKCLYAFCSPIQHFSMHTLLIVQHICCHLGPSAASLLGCACSITSVVLLD